MQNKRVVHESEAQYTVSSYRSLPKAKHPIEHKCDCESSTVSNDSGYSADESDAEIVTERQHKRSNKWKKREKKHRCDSDTDE